MLNIHEKQYIIEDEDYKPASQNEVNFALVATAVHLQVHGQSRDTRVKVI